MTGTPAGSPSLGQGIKQDVGIGHICEHMIDPPDNPHTALLQHAKASKYSPDRSWSACRGDRIDNVVPNEPRRNEVVDLARFRNVKQTR